MTAKDFDEAMTVIRDALTSSPHVSDAAVRVDDDEANEATVTVHVAHVGWVTLYVADAA